MLKDYHVPSLKLRQKYTPFFKRFQEVAKIVRLLKTSSSEVVDKAEPVWTRLEQPQVNS